MRPAHLSAASLLAIVLGLLPAAARASCAEFPPLEQHLEQAAVVFVGTIADLADDDRTALVDVEEIWRGGPMPAQVTVYGSAAPDDPGMTSVDRTYTDSGRYLFAVTVDEQGRLRDDSCTATREWSPDLDKLRPATVVTPAPAEDERDGGLPVPVVGVATLLLAIGAVSVFAFRARS